MGSGSCGADPVKAGALNGAGDGQPDGQRPLGVGIVDTIPLFRDGICALFERTPWLRLIAHSASEQGAVHMTGHLRPEVIVLDSGLDPHGHLVRKLAGMEHAPRVIVLVRATSQNPRYLATLMAAGAHGAVPRAAEPQRVLEAIRHALNSRRYLDPALMNLITKANEDAASTGGKRPAKPRAQLSPREHQVLELIAEGLENAAIARVLYLSVETVRTHVKGILRKLSARDRTHAVTIAFRSGVLSLTSEAAAIPAAVVSARVPRDGVV